MSESKKSSNFFWTCSRKTTEINESAPLVSRWQWRAAGVLVFDRPSATETARGGNERRDAPLMCSYVLLCALMCSYVLLCALMCSYVLLCTLMCSYVLLCALMCRASLTPGEDDVASPRR